MRIREAGPEADAAAQAAARLGTKGVKALQALMTEAAPPCGGGWRRPCAAAGTARAENAAVDALLDADPGVVDAAVRTLSSELHTLSAPSAGRWWTTSWDCSAQKGTRLPLASEAALLRLLAAAGDARAEPVFWARAEAPASPRVAGGGVCRRWALCRHPRTAPSSQRLLACAADTDFRVAAPALMILKAMPVSDRGWKDWLPLLDAAR